MKKKWNKKLITFILMFVMFLPGLLLPLQHTRANDANIEITFVKKASDTQKQLPGAMLKLMTGEQKTPRDLAFPGIYNWKTTVKPEIKQLQPDTYTLVETEAPNMYKKADPIIFKITNDGKLLIKKNDIFVEQENMTIEMVDEKIPTKNIEVRKVWAGIRYKNPEIGVTLYANGQPTQYKATLTSPKYTHTFKDLPIKDKDERNITYTVKEDNTSISNDKEIVTINKNLYIVNYETTNNRLIIRNTSLNKNQPLPLQTIVQAKNINKSATENKELMLTSKEANNVVITDTIKYSRLKLNEKYNITAKLYEVVDDKVDENSPLTIAKSVFTPKEIQGSVDVTFDPIQLDPSKKYVVFEEVESQNEFEYSNEDGTEIIKAKHKAQHKDPNDLSQTIVVGDETKDITVTKLWEKTSEDDKQDIKVFLYKNGQKQNDKSLTLTKTNPTQKFSNLAVRENGEKILYTVKEENEENNVVKVNDKFYKVTYSVNDNNITVTNKKISKFIPGILKTKAVIGDKFATDYDPITLKANEAKNVTITNTVQYSNLIPNTNYKIISRLMLVNEDKSTEEIEKKIGTIPSGAKGSGTLNITFTSKNLEAGKKYVIFEKVETTDDFDYLSENEKTVDSKKHVAIHENVDAKSQMIVVETEEKTERPADSKLRTTVGVDKEEASSEKELTIKLAKAENKTVVDKVIYEKLIPGKEYILTGTLMKIEGAKATQVGESVTKRFTAIETTGENEKDRTVEVRFENVKVEPNTKYVVFERVESVEEIAFTDNKTEKHVVKHEDKTDKAQTIVVEKTEEKTERPADSKLRTTVGVEGKEATTEEELKLELEASKTIKVVDKVVYENLIEGKEYVLTGTLMKITGEKAEAVSGPVEVKFTAKPTTTDNVADRTVEVRFENVKVEPNTKYVVFERVESVEEIAFADNKTEKHVLTHEDMTDKAQTIVVEKPKKPETPEHPKFIKVGNLATTVMLGDKKASQDKELEIEFTDAKKSVVKDLITYTDLVPKAEYKVTAELMKIVKDQNPIKVAEKNLKLITSENGIGKWVVTFDGVQLEKGARYVVFETAVSTNKYPQIKITGGEIEMKVHTVEHKDLNDKSQTIIVTTPKEQEKPGKPEDPKPKEPEKPGNPESPKPEEPEKPGKPENPKPEEPEKPGKPEGSKPEEPEKPGKPEDPKPEEPEKPGKPEDPKPEEQEKPGKPEDPKPEEPEKPGKPEDPKPEEPEKPGNPESSKPEEPEKPGKPESPKPEEPEKPGKPESPKPEEPEKPGKPESSKPDVPKNDDNSKTINDTIPKTGVTGTQYIFAIMLLVLLFIRKKLRIK